MRIEWHEDSARAVASMLEQIQQEMEQCTCLSQQVEDALREADPDGTNKQLKAISNRFQMAMRRIKNLAEDAEKLKESTNYMITTFENVENDVIRLLNNLTPGYGLEDEPGVFYTSSRPEEPGEIPPILFPKPYIAPTMRFSAMGSTMDWLDALMDRL